MHWVWKARSRVVPPRIVAVLVAAVLCALAALSPCFAQVQLPAVNLGDTNFEDGFAGQGWLLGNSPRAMPQANLRARMARRSQVKTASHPSVLLMTVLAELKRQGLIGNLGVSNVIPEQLAEALKITDIVCVQNYYNVAKRNDDAFIDRLAKDGIAS